VAIRPFFSAPCLSQRTRCADSRLGMSDQELGFGPGFRVTLQERGVELGGTAGVGIIMDESVVHRGCGAPFSHRD